MKNLTIKIEQKMGLIESYNLYDAKSKELALAKYNESIFLITKLLSVIEKKRKEIKDLICLGC